MAHTGTGFFDRKGHFFKTARDATRGRGGDEGGASGGGAGRQCRDVEKSSSALIYKG